MSRNYNDPVFSFKLNYSLYLLIIFSYVPKMNSIIIPLIETIATSLKFIAFCIKSLKPSQRYGSYLKLLSEKYQ